MCHYKTSYFSYECASTKWIVVQTARTNCLTELPAWAWTSQPRSSSSAGSHPWVHHPCSPSLGLSSLFISRVLSLGSSSLFIIPGFIIPIRPPWVSSLTQDKPLWRLHSNIQVQLDPYMQMCPCVLSTWALTTASRDPGVAWIEASWTTWDALIPAARGQASSPRASPVALDTWEQGSSQHTPLSVPHSTMDSCISSCCGESSNSNHLCQLCCS